MSVVVSQANAAPSTFLELDGNVVSDGNGTYDWANSGALTTTNGDYSRAGTGGVFDGGHFNGSTTPPTAPAVTATAAADPSIADAQFKIDPLSVDHTTCVGTTTAITGDPTVYTGAGSEVNGGLLSSDTFGTGSVPNKDDISNVYALAHVATGVNEVFFGAERVVNNGDSHIDFEFLQSAVTIPNACSGTFTGDRTQGDFLLSVDFTSGGTLGGIVLYKWLCDKGNGGLTDHTKDGQVCDPPKNGKSVPHYEITGTDAVRIRVNDAATSIGCGGWVCRNADGSPTATIAQNELMEGGIDLAQLGFTGCISTFLPHTRSSQSFTAVLKDFEVIPFNTCARPSVSTRIHNAAHEDVTGSSLQVPVTLHDTATLTDAVGTPAGSITYTLYSAPNCGGTATDVSPATSTFSGSLPDSAPVTFNNVGTYYFVASVTFTDPRNLGTPSSGCNDEPITITPRTPSVTTAIHDTAHNDVTGQSKPIGSVLHDTATISGATANAGGTISYALYSNNTCTALVQNLTPVSNTVTNGVAPDSSTYTFTNAGNYWFQATYSGDSNNTGPVSSVCTSEPITISPNTPSVTTAIHDASHNDVTGLSRPIGTVLHDTATISGATADAGGTISYALYSNNTCTTLVQNLTPVNNTVTNGVAPDSSTYTFTNAGNYWFQATYSGDSNNTGPVSSVCTSEPITISPNAPVPHSTPVVQVKDTFSVTGLTNGATGNLVVGVFTNNTCTTRAAGNSDASFLLTGNVSNGSYSNETTYFQMSSGTTYYFKLFYAGDNNNTGFNDCTESATATVVSKA